MIGLNAAVARRGLMVVLVTMVSCVDANVFSPEMKAWVTFFPVATENQTAHVVSAGQGTDAPTKNCQGAPTVAIMLAVPGALSLYQRRFGCVTVSSSAVGTVSAQTAKSRGLGAILYPAERWVGWWVGCLP